MKDVKGKPYILGGVCVSFVLALLTGNIRGSSPLRCVLTVRGVIQGDARVNSVVSRFLIGFSIAKNLFPQNDEDFRPATQTIDKMHIRTIERLKMGFRFYDCRHTFASRAVKMELTF